MTWKVKEIKAKIQRIKELQKAGLNTPRMFFLEVEAKDNDFEKALEWAEGIHKSDKNQIFNIRTYQREGLNETVKTIHATDITYESLPHNLFDLNTTYNCMIDAETPNDGRFAGNIIIETDRNGMPVHYTIDYCQRAIRAMVRDHDISRSGPANRFHDMINNSELIEVFEGAINSRLYDIILEWTYFCKPSGIMGENIVWWEYRKKLEN